MLATGLPSRVIFAMTLASVRRAGDWLLIRAVPWAWPLGFGAGAAEVAVGAAVAWAGTVTDGTRTARGVGVTAGAGWAVAVGTARGRIGRPAAAPASWIRPRSNWGMLPISV